jgi:hypothetical protein
MARSGVFAKSGRTDSIACNVDRRYPASKLHGWRRRRLGRSVSGRPGGGRKFGDSTDWKITQSRQDGNPDSRGQGF